MHITFSCMLMQRESEAASDDLNVACNFLKNCQSTLDEAQRSAAELHQLNLPHLTGAAAADPGQAHRSRGTKRKDVATENNPALETPQRPTSRRRSEASPLT